MCVWGSWGGGGSNGLSGVNNSWYLVLWAVSVDCMVGCFKIIVDIGCFIDIEQNPKGWYHRRDGWYCFLKLCGLECIKAL